MMSSPLFAATPGVSEFLGNSEIECLISAKSGHHNCNAAQLWFGLVFFGLFPKPISIIMIGI